MIIFLKKLYRWSFRTVIGRVVSTALAVAVWVLIWHAGATEMNEPLLLPTPSTVLIRLGELCATTAFWQHALYSLLRVLGGIVLGVLFAIITAVLTALLPPVHTLLRPVIATVKSTPVASFIILVMLWTHEDILPVVISSLMVFPIVWANLHTGIRAIPNPYLEMARVYRLPLGRRIRRIYIPSVLPYFLSACESALGLAWKAGIAAEVLAPATRSIGKHLYESKLYLETTDLFAWTLVVIVLSILLERLANLIFKRWQIKSNKASLHTEAASDTTREVLS